MRQLTRPQGPRLYGQIAGACIITFLGFRLLFREHKPEAAVRPCKGAETAVVQREEDYVRKHVQALADEAREIDSGTEPLDLVFYGDSIAETWRGTDMGRECGRCKGGPETFHKFFGSRYRARVFAVGGDQTAHLQWRLLNGELMVQNPPKVAVLMIGTNDLGAGAGCFGSNATLVARAVKQTFLRIEAIIDFFRIHTPETKIIVLGLTPRGVWSSSAGEFEWPSVFAMPIEALNHILHKLAAGQELVHYVDCGEKLLQDGKIDREMQGDGLHPTPEGLSVLASCILSAVEGILGPGMRPPTFLDQHPLKQWIRDQASSGSFWNV